MNNEPVAWIGKPELQFGFTDTRVTNEKESWDDIPLYTHPVKEQDESFDRTASHMAGEYVAYQKELTDEEIGQIWKDCMESPYMQESNPVGFARAILRKANEK
jgi:hypothetical protein